MKYINIAYCYSEENIPEQNNKLYDMDRFCLSIASPWINEQNYILVLSYVLLVHVTVYMINIYYMLYMVCYVNVRDVYMLFISRTVGKQTH